MPTELRVGTRGSQLALTQTRAWCQQLRASFSDLTTAEVLISTAGDGTTTPLSASPQPGVFVSALREALLDGRVDVIVHSMKDLPAAAHPGIVTACVPVREDSRDALVSRGGLPLAELPSGAVLGTSSPRRAAWVRRRRPDLTLVNIRGNIDTRIQKVRRGEVDATLLAMAGLNRIGRADEVSEIFEVIDAIPAPAQGALAVECRSEDAQLLEMCATLDHAPSRLTAAAERAVLLGLGAGCATAVGATARYAGGELTLLAELADESSGQAERVQLAAQVAVAGEAAAAEAAAGEAAAELLGLRVATRLRETRLADRVVGTFVSGGRDAMQPQCPDANPVLLIRAHRNEADARALARHGIASVVDPYLEIASSGNVAGARRLLAALGAAEPSWLIVTSPNALRMFAQLCEPGELERVIAAGSGLRFAAIGQHTRDELLRFGASDVLIPEEAYASSLAAALALTPPSRLVIPCGSRALTTLDEALAPLGFEILREVVYTTEAVADRPASAAQIADGSLRAVLFRSPSAASAFAHFAGTPEIAVYCAGLTTARAAEALGFSVTTVSVDPAPESLARTIAAHQKGSA